jgi:polar amino acid transport system substrate-binding protein
MSAVTASSTSASRPRRLRSTLVGVGLAVAALSLSGPLWCGVAAGVTVVPSGAELVKPTPPPPPSPCDPTASIAPPAAMPKPGAMPAGSWMAQIQQRGYLIAGVDQNTYLWGYRDPSTGQLNGFDIDMVRSVSQAIFGSPDRIHFTIVPNADRIKAVTSGEVDLVAETMTMTCQREKKVDFSSEYFEAGQEILVPTNSPITGPEDLKGKRVCAPSGSTSLQNLVGPGVGHPAQVWAVTNETDCLVMLQQHQVDAISTDNTILEGLNAQDPNTEIVGPRFSSEPYGMAISKAHPQFTSFVNGVLAQDRSDGVWAGAYARWLGPYSGGVTPAPPPPTYRSAP